jgi:hypothetical protein
MKIIYEIQNLLGHLVLRRLRVENEAEREKWIGGSGGRQLG